MFWERTLNVNAYPERTDVVTTLVEGKVRVGRGNTSDCIGSGRAGCCVGREFEP